MLNYSLTNFDAIRISFYSLGEEGEQISLTLPMEGFVEALKDVNEQLESF